MSKEDLAAKLRSILKVDVRFEKLSRDELAKLLDAVRKLVEESMEKVADMGEDRGPLGFGVIPSIRKQIMAMIPEVRREIQKVVDEIFFTSGVKNHDSRKTQK